MTPMLRGIVERLATAKAVNLIQGLTEVFTRLVLYDCSAVINFLSNLNIDTRSSLQVVMEVWCDNFESFSGYEEIRLRCVIFIFDKYLISVLKAWQHCFSRPTLDCMTFRCAGT